MDRDAQFHLVRWRGAPPTGGRRQHRHHRAQASRRGPQNLERRTRPPRQEHARNGQRCHVSHAECEQLDGRIRDGARWPPSIDGKDTRPLECHSVAGHLCEGACSTRAGTLYDERKHRDQWSRSYTKSRSGSGDGDGSPRTCHQCRKVRLALYPKWARVDPVETTAERKSALSTCARMAGDRWTLSWRSWQFWFWNEYNP